jgi:hypothetical protein
MMYKYGYPTSAIKQKPMMNGPRRLYLSEYNPTAMVATQPQTNGGIVSSWARAAVNPSSWMMVGVKSWTVFRARAGMEK